MATYYKVIAVIEKEPSKPGSFSYVFLGSNCHKKDDNFNWGQIITPCQCSETGAGLVKTVKTLHTWAVLFHFSANIIRKFIGWFSNCQLVLLVLHQLLLLCNLDSLISKTADLVLWQFWTPQKPNSQWITLVHIQIQQNNGRLPKEFLSRGLGRCPFCFYLQVIALPRSRVLMVCKASYGSK